MSARNSLFTMIASAALASLALSALAAEDAPKEGAAKDEKKPAAWHEGLKVEKGELGSTPFVSRFGDKVVFGGQIKAEEIEALKKEGVKVVVNLRPESEMTFDEKKLLEAAGIEYVNVPVEKDEPLELEALAPAMDALDKAADGKVLMHCASSNRVGMVWSVYRARRHGLSMDAAIEEGRAAGMKSPPLVELAKKLMLAAKESAKSAEASESSTETEAAK